MHIPAAYAHTLMVPEKTEVILKLLTPLKSGKTPVGEVVEFLVEKPIRSKEGTVLIEDAASAYGTVIVSKKSGLFGTPGKLDFKIDFVEAFNGVQVPLRATLSQTATGSEGAAIVGFLFVSVLSGLFRGDNISINPGIIFKAYVDKDTIIFNDAPELAEEIIVSGESDIDARLLKMYRDLEKK
ncbi:MAG: hypothetical protein PHO50_09145 [Aminobacterium colombiense]|nr:hypothetical protein [Aminobacterium colombiense]